MEIKIRITDIDYAKAIDTLSPALADKLSGCSNPIVSLAFGRAKSLSVNAAKAALKTLPQSARDELAAAFLNHYSAEISRMIANISERKSLPLKVQGIEVAALN